MKTKIEMLRESYEAAKGGPPGGDANPMMAFARIAHGMMGDLLAAVDALDLVHLAGEREGVSNKEALDATSLVLEKLNAEDVCDPSTPEGYALVSASPELLLKWQDRLDSVFQERVVDVRNALRELGFVGDMDDHRKELTSLFVKRVPQKAAWYQVNTVYHQVGAGRNVVGVAFRVKFSKGYGELATHGVLASVRDDLSMTPAMFAIKVAAEVDAHDPDQITPVETGEYTPSPWHIGKDLRIIGSNSQRVAVCDDNEATPGWANALVISAAPVLLETLQKLVNEFDPVCSPMNRLAVQARTLIAETRRGKGVPEQKSDEKEKAPSRKKETGLGM